MEISWKADGNIMDLQICGNMTAMIQKLQLVHPCAHKTEKPQNMQQGIRWKSDGYPMEIRWKPDGFPMVLSFRKSRKSCAQKTNIAQKSRTKTKKQTHLCICWITNKKEHAQKTQCRAWFWAYRHVTVMCWRFMCSRYCKGTTHCVEMALTREGDGARRLRSQGGRRLRSQGGASEAWGSRVPAQESIYVC